MKSRMIGIGAAMAAVFAMGVAGADEPAKPAPKPATAQQAKFETAVTALFSTNAGVHAGAIVALEEVGADEAASKALRGDAWQKAIDARWFTDKAPVSVLFATFRRALEAGLDASTTVRLKMRMTATLIDAKDLRGAKETIEPLGTEFDRLPREVQHDLAPQLASVLAANGDTTNAIRWTTVFLDKGLASSDSEEIAQRLKLADLLVASGKTDDGLAVATKLMDRINGMVSSDAAAVMQWIVQRQTDAGNLKAAADAVRKVLATRNVASVSDILLMRNRLASILYAAKDEAAAEQEYRAVLAVCKNFAPELRQGLSAAAEVAMKALLQMHRTAGRSDRVLELTEESLADPIVSAGTVAVLVEAGQWAAGTNSTSVDRVIDALRRRAAKQADDASVVDVCQQAVVRLELAVPGRTAEALQEVRIYYRVCPTAKLADAAELVALAFKSADRNLSRANAFLKFQKYGPAGMDGAAGTPDDIADPLAALPAVAKDAPRNKPFADALTAVAGDYAGMRVRARLLLLMDQGGEAFEAQVRAFELCPAKDVDLQSATDDLTALVVRHTRDLALAQRVVDYVMYGPAGVDGKPGTPDDPGDVFGDVRKRLSGNGG